ncbi:MAG: hypothetical protein Q9Q13_04250 [Acidobacteriota bacterium]|nr:hypothetical protein [Acidobacteriota bacterium]
MIEEEQPGFLRRFQAAFPLPNLGFHGDDLGRDVGRHLATEAMQGVDHRPRQQVLLETQVAAGQQEEHPAAILPAERLGHQRFENAASVAIPRRGKHRPRHTEASAHLCALAAGIGQGGDLGLFVEKQRPVSLAVLYGLAGATKQLLGRDASRLLQIVESQLAVDLEAFGQLAEAHSIDPGERQQLEGRNPGLAVLEPREQTACDRFDFVARQTLHFFQGQVPGFPQGPQISAETLSPVDRHRCSSLA